MLTRYFRARSGTLGLDVSGDEFGHLEHGDLAFAVKDGLERVVRVDHGPLLFVLKSVLLDVVPELLCQSAAGQGSRADNCRQSLVRLDRLHEGGVGLARS